MNNYLSSEQETELIELMNNCLYIKDCVSNKRKDTNSLSYLIDNPLSQSDCIKLGHGLEKLLVDIIVKKTHLQNIKTITQKGEKEKDHLFIDNENNIIYYAELKSNLYLDTEKSKSTYTKCLEIVKKLKSDYPGYEIKWCLLGLRYLNYKEIPTVIKKKYDIIKNNLFGINQYFEMLNINLKFDNKEYKKFLNTLATTMFNKTNNS